MLVIMLQAAGPKEEIKVGVQLYKGPFKYPFMASWLQGVGQQLGYCPPIPHTVQISLVHYLNLVAQ